MGDAHRPVWTVSLAPLSTLQQTGTSSVPHVGEEEEEKEEQEMLCYVHGEDATFTSTPATVPSIK
jgi:hypothetical protein